MKLHYFAGIVFLTAVLILAVCMSSPYAEPAPSVQPLRPIEELWALEDERRESASPLVTKLLRDGTELGYDAEKQCFYCPLPLETEAWPELNLTAPDSPDVQMYFADDYLYDTPKDAMASGTAYRVFACTKTEFCYFSVVFTGMAQICLHASQEFAIQKDVPAAVSVSDGTSGITQYGRVHYRGGVTSRALKHSYRVEFTRKSNGKKKIRMDVPGMGEVHNLILLPMVYDSTLMRDRLSWDIYERLLDADIPFGKRKMQYAELFVNDEYQGVYLMMEPYAYQDELEKAGSLHPSSDYVYRVSAQNGDRYQWTWGSYIEERGFRLLYAPGGATDPFAGLAAYRSLVPLTDGAYASACREHLDTDSMLRILMLTQMGGMTDNIFNNLGVWADNSSGETVYRFFPWDMDQTWGERPNRIGLEYDFWMYFPTCDRLLQMDADGMRNRAYALWQSLRQNVLTADTFEALTAQYVHELNDSGAMQRDGECWGNEHYIADPEEILDYCGVRLAVLDKAFRYIAEKDGPVEFLNYSDYDSKSRRITYPDPEQAENSACEK